MTLDQLQVIEMTVKEGSITAAAKKLNKAPSALSIAIKSIEDYWGVHLFDRSEYRLKLSAEGEALYSKISRILQDLGELERHALSLGDGLEPQLKISINILFPIQRIEKLLYKISKKFPNVQLSISVVNREKSMKKLKNREVDFIISQYEPRYSTIKQKRILDTYLVGVAGKNYVSNGSISKSELQSKTQIIVSSMNPNDKSEKPGLIGSSNQWSVADINSKLSLIKNNLGYGFMPNYLVTDLIKKNKLIELKAMKKINTPMYIYHLHDQIIGKCKKFFWDEV